MSRSIAALLTITVSATPAAAQAVWNERDIGGGGAEFRLGNGEGAAIILACQLGGVSAGFEFPEPLEATGSASVRGVPGEWQNIAVAPVDDREIRDTTGRGIAGE